MSDEPTERAREVTFEQALEELEAIVHALEEGRIGLEEALARYEQGVKLLRRCHELLQRAERRIALLTGVDAEGNPISQPLDDAAVSLEEKARTRSRRRTSSEPGHTPRNGGESLGQTDVDSPSELF